MIFCGHLRSVGFAVAFELSLLILKRVEVKCCGRRYNYIFVVNMVIFQVY